MMVSAQHFLMYVLPTMVLAGAGVVAFVSSMFIRWDARRMRRKAAEQKEPEYHI